jgi:hypothetical protein
MLVHIFRGPGRVFGLTEDATGAHLPWKFSPWTAFKSIELSRNGEPRAGVNTMSVSMTLGGVYCGI